MTSHMSVSISQEISTSPPLVSGAMSDESGRRIFSAADAMNLHLSLIQLISALCRASCIASGTISIHSNSSQIHDFKKLIQILPAPQYKSNTFHLISQMFCIQVANSLSAQCVFVWKNENGEILNLAEIVSLVSLFVNCNSS